MIAPAWILSYFPEVSTVAPPGVSMKAPEQIETSRLILHRPCRADAGEIFSRYASDPGVTTYMSFPTHCTLDDAYAFLSASDAEWEHWPAGPYLMRLRADDTLVGGTGLHFETSYRAMTGYILAKDSWGKGFAQEGLQAMIGVARTAGVRRLYAVCHTGHERSWRVLERCGFGREGILRAHTVFPNLASGRPEDVFSYALIL
jgi:RimJ/RimL family protein N-acetyltransferase